MSSETLFFSQDLKFEAETSDLSEQQINNVIFHNFIGKEDFIKFYLSYNGIYFPEGAMVNYYRMSKGDYSTVEIESFYHIRNESNHSNVSLAEIWEYTKKRSSEAKKFAESHIPFAGDTSGNDFWIEIPSGQIIYMSWEYGLPDGKILIAPTFKSFCLAIRSL